MLKSLEKKCQQIQQKILKKETELEKLQKDLELSLDDLEHFKKNRIRK